MKFLNWFSKPFPITKKMIEEDQKVTQPSQPKHPTEVIDFIILTIRPGSPTTSRLTLRRLHPREEKRIPGADDISIEVEGRDFSLDGTIRIFVKHIPPNKDSSQIGINDVVESVGQLRCV